MDPVKRERILDAAGELFARFGFRKTSIDEVAEAANVGKGTVYLVCRSKEDLFYQVVHRELRAWVAEIGAMIDPRQPADALLVRCSLTSFQYLQDRPLVRDLLLGNHEEMLPLWVNELEDLRAIGRRNTAEILELGVRQGRFRRDLDVATVAKILQDVHAMGLLVGFREKKPLDEQVRLATVAVDLLLNGLLAR